MSDGTVKAGVIGVGALGRHHARVWAGVEGARLVGVFDADAARAAAVAAEHGGRAFPDAASLLAELDAVSVAVPTESHHRVARLARHQGRLGCQAVSESRSAAVGKPAAHRQISQQHRLCGR